MQNNQKRTKMAICYDFDGTLAPGNMHEHGFIQAIGMSIADFWEMNNKLAYDQTADQILTYMRIMKEKTAAKGLPFTRAALRKYGTDISFFPGVLGWFKRINEYALKQGVQVEHYIISSGLKEMVEGTKIAPYFKEIFASTYMYDDQDNAIWPALSINYTNKTQFLYRINKGVLDAGDHIGINQHMNDADKPIPFERIIYVGDGETDVPSMKTVKGHGGYAVAVYQNAVSGHREKVCGLMGKDRADLIAPADYQENTLIDIFVKGVIDKIVADIRLKEIQKSECGA